MQNARRILAKGEGTMQNALRARCRYRAIHSIGTPNGNVMSKGTHDYTPDPRNASIKINLNGTLVPR
ncbi:MAG TPA: hypothetical protein VF284_05255, partial [Rhodanobacteraceae bacterium]